MVESKPQLAEIFKNIYNKFSGRGYIINIWRTYPKGLNVNKTNQILNTAV
jgi:hypothetical protein